MNKQEFLRRIETKNNLKERVEICRTYHVERGLQNMIFTGHSEGKRDKIKNRLD